MQLLKMQIKEELRESYTIENEYNKKSRPFVKTSKHVATLEVFAQIICGFLHSLHL